MATRAQFENSNEIGVFANLTNAYALVAIGGSENFYSIFEQELIDHIPVVHTSIAGCRFVGRVTVGKSIASSHVSWIRYHLLCLLRKSSRITRSQHMHGFRTYAYSQCFTGEYCSTTCGRKVVRTWQLYRLQ
jgi:hypothetical protein